MKALAQTIQIAVRSNGTVVIRNPPATHVPLLANTPNAPANATTAASSARYPSQFGITCVRITPIPAAANGSAAAKPIIVVITALSSYSAIVIAASRPPIPNAVAAVSPPFTKIALPTSTDPASSARCTSLRSARSRIASAKAAANQMTSPAAAAHISELNRMVVRWSVSQLEIVLSESPTVGRITGQEPAQHCQDDKGQSGEAAPSQLVSLSHGGTPPT